MPRLVPPFYSPPAFDPPVVAFRARQRCDADVHESVEHQAGPRHAPPGAVQSEAACETHFKEKYYIQTVYEPIDR